MEQVTKEEVVQDLVEVMLAFAISLDRVFYRRVGLPLLNVAPSSKASAASDLESADLDPDSIGLVVHVFSDLYDYAIEGKRAIQMLYEDDCEDTVLFLRGLEQFPLLDESGVDFRFDRIRHILNVANARFALDDGDGVTTLTDPLNEPLAQWGVIALHDVALLAGMDEKSVRNAANPKHKNPLKTFNYGRGTYVKVDDAREWLSGRRGYKQTVYFDRCVERDFAKHGFVSPEDLASYLERVAEAKGVSIAGEASGDTARAQALMDALSRGEFRFDADVLEGLARKLDLDVKGFVLACLTLHQKIERQRLERHFQQ